MKTKLLFVLTVFAMTITVAAAAVAGNSYFVSPSMGDDSYAGTEEAPFATITNALEVAREGDSIYLYGETFYPEESIVIESGISIFGVAGETVLSGLDAESGEKRALSLLNVNNDAARVSGIIFENAKPGAESEDGSIVVLRAGEISWCVVRNNTIDKRSANSVFIGGGAFVDSVVSNNACTTIYSTSGMKVMGGEVLRTSVVYNMATGRAPYCGGVWIYGGYVADCDISYNSGNAHGQNDGYAAMGVFQFGGIMERCLITHNSNSDGGNAMGGLQMKGAATNRYCFIAYNYNTSTTWPGGAALNHANALLEHATIFGNTSSAGNDGLYVNKGSVVNSIIYGNGDSDSDTDVIVSQNGSISYSCYPEAVPTAENGNVSADPLFADAEAGDVHLIYPSPAIDACAAIEGTLTDLDGKAVPFDGDGANGAEPDMGCYEWRTAEGESFACSFAADKGACFLGEALVFTPIASATIASCKWTIVDAGGNVVNGSDNTSQGNAAYTFKATEYGIYTVMLEVTSNGEAVSSLPQSFAVTPETVYLSKSGSNTYPYASEATAAHELADAVDVYKDATFGGTVVVMHHGDVPYTITRRAVVDKKMKIIGDKDNLPVFDAADASVFFMSLNHDDAVVANLIFQNSNPNTYAGEDDNLIFLKKGVVTNCIVRNCEIRANSMNAVLIRGGIFTDCVVSNNYDNWSRGSPTIKIYDGKVIRTSVLYNTVESSNPWCGGIWMMGGLASECVISHNSGTMYGNNDGHAPLAARLEGGIMERCTITHNVNYSSGYGCIGGIYLRGAATLRNSLIAFNSSSSAGRPGGVRVNNSGAVVENCTIYGNYNRSSTANDGLLLESGTVRNCIIYGNGDLVDEANLAKSGGSITFSCYPEATVGTTESNITDVVYFRNVDEEDFRLVHPSKAIDAGCEVEAVSDDRDGVERPYDGDGDKVARTDIGCYEWVPNDGESFAAWFSADHASYFAPATIVLTPEATSEIISCEWIIEKDGADSVSKTTSGAAALSHEIKDAGIYTVMLKVTDKNGMVATSLAKEISVTPSVVYVSPAGSHTWPFESEAKAATNLIDAVEIFADSAEGGTIYIKAGDYVPVRTMTSDAIDGSTSDYIAIVETPIKIIGDGRDVVVLRCIAPTLTASGTASGIALTSTGAEISGVSITGANGGHALAVIAGRASNIAVTNNIINKGIFRRAPLLVKGGVVDNALVAYNTVTLNNTIGGIYITGGEVKKSVVRENTAGGNGGASTPGIFLEGGVVRDTQIIKNSGKSFEHNQGWCATGVKMIGGTLERCVIAENVFRDSSDDDSMAGLLINGNTTVKNCLIYGNTNTLSPAAAGVLVKGGTTSIENITVVDNVNAKDATKGGVTFNNARVSNCIIAYNGETTATTIGNNVTYSCFASADGTSGNTATLPKFKGREKGDYRLSGSDRALINGGSPETAYAQGDIDLGGEKRKIGITIDMGCYEYYRRATIMRLE